MDSEKKYLKNFIGLFTAIIAFIVYYQTISPTVNFIDSGELAAVASTLGIAHPTGYPLFTLIGYLFSKIPIDLPIIKKLNFLSAIFSAVGVFIFYQLLFLLHTNILKKFNSLTIYMVSATSALILGFSKTYWSISTSIEVYSLHILFVALILYLNLKLMFELKNNKIDNDLDGKYYLLTFFVLGLSFSNHMTTILFLPAIIYLLYHTLKNVKNIRKINTLILGSFLLGISVYLYLLIQASNYPFFNWGNPSNFERLFWHISGKQYRVWIFSSTESAVRQLQYYISNFSNEFSYVFVLIGLFGAYQIYKGHIKLFVFLIILFITCVGYSINYDIHDIDSYFLISYFVYGIFTSVGLLHIVQKFQRIKFLIFLILLLAVIPLFSNYHTCDESENYLVEDYTKNVFNSVDQNSIIISYQWDYFVSASYYFQVVEEYRKDVVVIDKELLRRSWYFEQLKNNYPEIYKKSQVEIKLFMEELYKFEHGISYDVRVIEQRYSDVIRSFIEKNYNERRIYVTPEIEDQYLIGYIKVPSGLCYQIVKEEKDRVIKKIDFEYRGIEREDRLINGMKKLYLRACVENGIFMLKLGKSDLAREYFEKGLKINPSSSELRYYYNQIKR